MQLSPIMLERIITAALLEDLGIGDVTTCALISSKQTFAGIIAAREPLVVAGLELAYKTFARLTTSLDWQVLVTDGDYLMKGDEIVRLEGPARQLLSAERTALNFLQHLSGIATLTHIYIELIAGTGVVLLDTRKTIPGLRELAKYATRVGGAKNHRMRLDDGILIKDNHIAVVGSIKEAIRQAQAFGFKEIEVECETLEQVYEALQLGITYLLLDNMDIESLKQAVLAAKGYALTEASGGINFKNIRSIADTGVDFISVGCITQSAPAVDIGLDFKTCLR